MTAVESLMMLATAYAIVSLTRWSASPSDGHVNHFLIA